MIDCKIVPTLSKSLNPSKLPPLPHLELSLYTSNDTSMMQAAVHSNFFYKLQPLFFFDCCLISMTHSVNVFVVFWSVEAVRAFEMAINIYTDMVRK